MAKVWLPVLAVLLAADVSFDLWFWRIPKLTGTNADFGYQFLVDAQTLRADAADGRPRVVAFGSSVAGSFDPLQVASLLRARGEDADVHRLLLPAAHPTDYFLYFDADSSPPPAVVVILFNLVDFLFSGDARDVNPTLRYALPPLALWRERRGSLGVADHLDLLLASASDLYRFRRPLRSAVQDHARMLARWGRSRPIDGPYGIHPDGFTERRFGLATGDDGWLRLRYHVAEEWIRQRGRVGITVESAGRLLAEREQRHAGWNVVEIRLPQRQRVDVTLDSTWSPRAAGGDDRRLLGVRLDPALVPEGDTLRRAPFRRRPLEAADIDTFLRMGGERGEGYVQRWNEVMEAPTRFGQRFRVYRDAKRAVRDRPFVAEAEFRAVADLARLFVARGSRVVLINTPESPLMLAEYGSSAYYAAYRRYFADIAAAVEGVTFADLSEALGADDFNDLHHPTFVGAIQLGARYAEIVRRALDPDADADASAGRTP